MTYRSLLGRRFGRLVAVSHVGMRGKNSFWQCKCDCGEVVVVSASNLVYGNQVSCGCQRREKCSALGSRVRSTVLYAEVDGKRQSLKAWSRELEQPYTTMYNRYRRGWGPREVVYGKGA